MWQINILSGIFLLILGFIIIRFKMSYLIAGYNTSSKKEKEKYDEDKLIRSVGKFLINSALILLFGGFISIIIENISKEIILGSWILYTFYTIVWVLYVNISGCLIKK